MKLSKENLRSEFDALLRQIEAKAEFKRFDWTALKTRRRAINWPLRFSLAFVLIGALASVSYAYFKPIISSPQQSLWQAIEPSLDLRKKKTRQLIKKQARERKVEYALQTAKKKPKLRRLKQTHTTKLDSTLTKSTQFVRPKGKLEFQDELIIVKPRVKQKPLFSVEQYKATH